MDLRKKSIIFALFFLVLFVLASNADTLRLRSGGTVKGLILDEYKDRIVISTVNGELVVLKSDIDSAVYDSEEKTLLRKADNLFKKGRYIKAYYAYADIVDLNPGQNEARLRMNYLRHYVENRIDNRFRGKSAKNIYSGEHASQDSPLEKLEDSYGIVLVQKDDNVFVGKVIDTFRNRYFKSLEPGDRIVNVWGEMSAYMDAREVAALMMNSEQVSLEIERSLKPELALAGNALTRLFFGYRKVIGAKLILEREGIKISSLEKDGPFAASGVKKDDMLSSIDGKDTRYMPMRKVIAIIMDSQGKFLEIVIRRKLTFWRKV